MNATTKSCIVRSPILALAALAVLVGAAVPAAAEGGVTFRDLAADPASGLAFTHTAPPRRAILEAFQQNGLDLAAGDLALIAHKPHGAPGVAILDHDNDGDLDLYVTNSIGGANALFSSQLVESGEMRYVDVAAAAGVDALDHDSTGVCFGDLDNDGDRDLMVLGAIMPNRLYENLGPGSGAGGGVAFADITASSGVGGGPLSTSSCSMGDVNGDGLLDIAVANTHTTWNDLLGIVIPFTFNEHNQLFLNTGGNVFADVSAGSGFETLGGLPPGAAALTWAIALVDYDSDGDVDAFTFDDQGGVPAPIQGGLNYGIIHLHENDGNGNFTDITVSAGLVKAGNWMGVDFGDLDCDGDLDVFATNTGDYPGGGAPRVFPVGFKSSRWFLNESDGTFSDPGVGDLGASVFGWGASVSDYDNDGDADILYHGAIDLALFTDASNPGVILRNQGCGASFVFDRALADAADHVRQLGQGLATADLDGNGFLDVVTVWNAKIPDSAPLFQENDLTGSVFDDDAIFLAGFLPPPAPGPFVWSGISLEDGGLNVQLAEGNGNGSAAVRLRGSVGTLSNGRVNRDGIGAVVTFTTPGGKRQMTPIAGGSSYASQHGLEKIFGLGSESSGTLEVLWPGGVRNRLHGVRAGQRVLFPEIPCDLDEAFEDRAAYVACVRTSLDALVEEGILDRAQKARFLSSALAAN